MPSEVAAVMDIVLTSASIAATVLATESKIDESLADYTADIARINARITETDAEGARRLKAAGEEGALSLTERAG